MQFRCKTSRQRVHEDKMTDLILDLHPFLKTNFLHHFKDHSEKTNHTAIDQILVSLSSMWFENNKKKA